MKYNIDIQNKKDERKQEIAERYEDLKSADADEETSYKTEPKKDAE